MLIVSFAIWYEMIQGTAHASDFVRAIEERELRVQYSFRACLTRAWLWNEAEACVWNVSGLMWS